MTSKEIFARIKELLLKLESEIEYDNSGDEFDINCYAEDFYAGLLNIIFEDWNLINLNRIKYNHPAVDIGDEIQKVAIQITTTNTPKKIQDTLDTFFSSKHQLDLKYNKVYILLIKGKSTLLNQTFSIKKPNSFKFKKDEHIIDNSTIIGWINDKFDVNKKAEKLEQIYTYINKEIGKKPSYAKFKEKILNEINLSNGFGDHVFRILHLSNFSGLNFDIDQKYLSELIRDIKLINDNNKIDFICFSGNLLNYQKEKNEINEESFYKIYEKSLYQISQQIHNENCFIVPGIVDVISEKDPEWQDKGLSELFKNTNKIDEFIEKEKITKKFDGINRIKPFKDFEEIIYRNFLNKDLSAFDSNLIIDSNNKKIGISCLNSVWRYHSENQESKLQLGELQIQNGRNYLINCDLKIAICHNPSDSFSDVDKSIILEKLLNFDLVFFGHNTDTKVYTGFYDKTFIELSPTSISHSKPENDQIVGYSLIDYDFRKRIINREIRHYNAINEYFTYSESKVYKFPTTEELIADKKSREYIKTIKSTHIEDVDSHLICHGIDSKSPQNLDKIFVMPLITNTPHYDRDDTKIQIFEIDDIIDNDDDIILFGQKESGKTILLDKLLIRITEKYNALKLIPIYIDFAEIGNKSIITIIKNYISGTTEEIKSRLKNAQIILLIDDLEIDVSFTHRLNKIQEIKNSYPKTRLICTSERISEHDFPMYYSENIRIKFKPLYLHSFRTKQIKGLIKNWFSSNPKFEDEKKFENIINNFKAFGLPRTPMAISLFLWIIEKQEKRPINNAKLLEKFIDGILDKTNKEEIYREKFDSENKQHLLAEIAKFVYDKDKECYCVDYGQLVDFLHNYFKEQKYETVFNAKRIVDNLTERGMFIKHENSIKFRFACFFHFFLAKQMDFDTVFREFVLKEENYLDFTDEIDYYTGLERNAESILEILSERMDKGFEHLKSKITYEHINQLFNTQRSIVQNIDLAKVVENKPSSEQIESIHDDSLDKTPERKQIEKKGIKKTQNDQLNRLIKLTANVLRNTEIVKKNNTLKEYTYNKVVNYLMLCLVRDKLIYMLYYDTHKKLPDYVPSFIDINSFLKILPIIFQVTLYDWIGTSKLSQVVKEKIQSDKKNAEISEIEKFMSVFVYADIQATDYPEIVKNYIKDNADGNTIRDLSFFKILTYYYLRAKKGTDTEKIYLDLLADLKIRSNKIDHKNKGIVIKQLQESKEKQNDLLTE